MILIVPVVCALAGLSAPGDSPQAAGSPAVNPIAIEIGQQSRDRGGLLDLLVPYSDNDTLPAERALADALSGRFWIDLTDGNPEVAVAVRWQQRNDSRPSRSKDGKNITITYTYKVSAAIATRREKDQIDAEATVSTTYAASSSRREPSRSNDRDGYQRAGRELGTKVRTWVLSRIETLRPDGPAPGFPHADQAQAPHHRRRPGSHRRGARQRRRACRTAARRPHPQGRRRERNEPDGRTRPHLAGRLGCHPGEARDQRDKKRQTIAFDLTPTRRPARR